MSRKQLGTVVHHVRKLAEAPADRSDGELLRRFAAGHEAAFAALVQRHGPLVLSVCRRVLGHEQDAEDAFQATFLVLARKAASLRREESLASFLFGVARRTALKARTGAANRRVAGGKETPRAQPEPPAEASLRELQRLLDEEVSRLPDKYRAPFVLCCLEGLGRAEAARQLGWNEGTLSGRLALARQRLRRRLTRRGVTLTAALCAVALSPAGKAAVPAVLAGGTVRGALGFPAANGAEAGPARTAALAGGVLRALSRTNRKTVTVLALLALGAAGAGAVGHALRAPAGASAAAARPETAGARDREGDRPRADRYGDPLPPGAIARLGTVRFRGWADGVAFLPGDKVLATGGREVVSFWDVATGRETRHRMDMRWGSASALSADGKVLAVAAVPNDNTIHLWEVATGRHLRQLAGHQGWVRALAFAADGRTLVSGGLDGQGTVRVWDTDTGKEVRRIDVAHPVDGVAVSPDGKTLASAGWDVASTVSVRETATGRELHRFRLPLGVRQVVFAPDGKTLAAVEDWNDDAGPRENKVHLWDVATGKLRRELALREHINGLAFSPDNKTLATGHLDTFHVWDLATGKWLERFEGHSGRADHVAFSGDGKTLATSGNNTIQLWEVATGKVIPCPVTGHQGPVQALAFLGDSKTLVTAGGDGTLRHWEAATGREVRRFPGRGGEVFGPTFAAGKTLAVPVNNEVRLCEPATGKALRRLRFPDHVRHVALTLDGKTLAVYTGGKDVTLRLVDLATGKERLARRYPEVIQVMAFSPGGEVLALGPVNPVLRLLDAATGREVHQLPLTENVTNLTFAPDGKTLAGGAGYGTLRFWEVATGKERARRPDRDLRSGSAMAFSPDGRVLVLGDADGTLRLCRAATGEELGRLRGHRGGITCLAFSADGRTLASGSWDTTALVWDVSGLLKREGEQPGDLGPRQLEAFWTDLAGDDAPRAYRAIQELSAAPRQTVPFLRARLRPAAAAEPRQVAALLADLDSDDFRVRAKATAELEKLGESAEPALRKALQEQLSPEASRRVRSVLGKLRGPLPGPERLRELRALEVLEQIGSVEAGQVLAALAAGAPEARLTRDARSALGRRPEKGEKGDASCARRSLGKGEEM